jgi:hypothetical protein
MFVNGYCSETELRRKRHGVRACATFDNPVKPRRLVAERLRFNVPVFLS